MDTKKPQTAKNNAASVKLPRSAAYLYNNLSAFHDVQTNTSFYGVIHGLEAYIVEHFESTKLLTGEAKEPVTQVKKLPYDQVERISCVKWCTFRSETLFIVGTDSGLLYFYDFTARKLHYSHDIISNQTKISSSSSTVKRSNSMTDAFRPTVNCMESDGQQLLFVGLSSGKLLSFHVKMDGISNKMQIYQNSNKEAINCMTKPNGAQLNKHKRNVVYFGCDDGSVMQYNCATAQVEALIQPSTTPRLLEMDEFKLNTPSPVSHIGNRDDDAHNQENVVYPNTCGGCLSMACCDSFLVAGYMSGHIKIVEKSELSFVIKQVAAHRRAVTAIAILEKMNFIATVSEDGFYHVLKNSSSSSLDVIQSQHFDNSMLVGVAFLNHPPSWPADIKYRDKMLVMSAYDTTSLWFV